MCEQTEISYLDGDVVWVKLGACWWPGQVTGFHNLPEDIQNEFQRKPLIAAVKFFQEDTYEFVKNYQQIYKYNCTLKDEFIKKGLDKHRSKSKDGASYMAKFPGDVEMAEKLTGGDPDILNSEKFSPEERPDISGLFGDKKMPKKKKEREDGHRRSADIIRKITHPRFLRESDHEVRIRQQPSSLHSTPNSSISSPQYPCHLCEFTSSRVNVIICHIKSHRSGNSSVARSKVKTYSQPRSRNVDTDTPKRKYVRKEKSQWAKSKTDSGFESGKRKQTKQSDKVNKKKKTDPELREKLLADWDDESDEDICNSDSINANLTNSSLQPEESSINSHTSRVENETAEDAIEIIEETEKFLRETEKLRSIRMMEETIGGNISSLKSFGSERSEKQIGFTKCNTVEDTDTKLQKKGEAEAETVSLDNDSKHVASDRDDKKSRLSCFDFDEDDLPEPSIPPVRKIPRVFGEKSLSLKKEIIKEFEMSEALKAEQQKESDKENMSQAIAHVIDTRSSDTEMANEEGEHEAEMTSDSLEKGIPVSNDVSQSKVNVENEVLLLRNDQQKQTVNPCETEVEIVEIFEVEKEEGDEDRTTGTTKSIDGESHCNNMKTMVSNVNNKTLAKTNSEAMKTDKKESQSKDDDMDNVVTESSDNASTKELDETLSEQLVTETEDDTVSESAETLPEQSENSDSDLVEKNRISMSSVLSARQQVTPEKLVKRKRGRPRKKVESADANVSAKSFIKVKDKEESKTTLTVENITTPNNERSYTGRKRKPNKKYLESGIYVQDSDQRSFKTDDSQSESDEKVVEKQTSKPKKNKALTMLDKSTDSTKKNEERELELSDDLLNTSEGKSSKSGLPHNVSDGAKGKKFIGLEKRLIENQPDIVDICEQSTKNSEAPSILENVNAIVSEHVPSPLGKDTMLQETKPKVPQKEMTSAAGSVNEMDKGSKEMSTKDNRIKPGADNSSNHTQSDSSRGGIDMLPPKKSQIKKFELSKSDFSNTGDPESNMNIELDKIKEDERIEVEGDDIKMNAEKESHDASAIKPKEAESVESIVREQAKDITVKSTTDKLTDKLMVDEESVAEQDTVASKNVSEPLESEPANEQLAEYRLKSTDQILDEVITKTLNEQSPLSKRSSMQTRYKGKFTPETGTKSKRDKELFTEEKPVNTFQEAFLKTLQIDKKKGTNDDGETAGTKVRKGKKTTKRKSEEPSTGNVLTIISQDAKQEDSEGKSEVAENSCDIKMQQSISEVPALSSIEEVVTEENVGIDATSENVVLQSSHRLAPTKSDFGSVLKVQTHLKADDASKSAISEVQKSEDSTKTSPAPTSDVSVPVKKREMPRIIESVTLTEPMQILKSKLLDKLPQKGVKHKLEPDGSKKAEIKTGPTKAKIMKIESLPTSSKLKTGLKVTSPHLSLTKKLQVLKAEEAEAAAIMDKQKEKLSTQTQQLPARSGAEKYIQQSSQSLADMELDINSMPFVLSEDVLTPESIEQMPVVISSIIPASSSIPATLSFTPGTQIVTANQAQFQMAGDNTTEVSPTKKKSGTPAILKSKNKAKPTITSIKTLVPPLTGGVKGLKFQSAQTAKSSPVLTQKGTPGKYVVVQTGGQQLRYTVQGRVGAQQKIALPAGKTSSNAQVVQQGSKVVILTSAQSGQTKMLPLNISKTISGKVQRIMTSKSQVFCPISPQSIITSKTVIAPKGDVTSATTSKLSSGQKVINTQGILTSKGLLTPVAGTITKTAPLLGNLQGIIMKEGFISGKTIIGPKTVMARNAILSTQSLGSSKAIFTPISQTITSIPGKPILGTAGICAKGTVLTPITGQQVKAIAAKSPSKSKVQYQSVQQKVQLPMLQKSPKTSVSASSQPRGSIPFNSSALSLKAAALILQNVMPSSKVMTPGKKLTKTGIAQQSTTLQSVPSQSSTQEQMISIQQQKGKTVTSPSVQKVFVPRGSGRQTKSQQKIVVQKVQDPAISQVHNIQSKQGITMSSSNVSLAPKATQRYGSGMAGLKFATKTQSTTRNLQQQKNLLNVGAGVSNVASSTTSTGICSSDINAAVSTVAASATVNAATMVTTAISAITTTSTAKTSTLTSMSLPPLEPLEPEVKLRPEEPSVGEQTSKEQQKVEKYVPEKGNETEKVEETKIPAQPQIMALPTESSDGTQTYVLVTIDEHGQIQPLDNNTLMSLEGTTQNPDGTRTLYIDPSSLGEAGTLDNIVLQFDSGVLPSVQTNVTESSQPTITESFSTPEIMQTSNQDILAAALANTDFQQEINLPENSTGSVMTAGLTQTSLINQTILQSTIIPPTEPISSPSVLETSLTLNQPIMTPLEVPSSLAIQPEIIATSVVPTIPSSLELPITVTNPSISYITAGGTQLQIPGNSMPDIGEIMESPSTGEIPHTEIPASTQYLVIPSLDENMSVENQPAESGRISMPTVSYAVPVSNNVVLEATQVQTTPSMPIIDDSYVEGVQFPSSMDTSIGEEQESFTDVPVSEMLISKADIEVSEDGQNDDVGIAEKKIVSLEISGSPQDSSLLSQNKSLLSSEAERTSTSSDQAYASDLLPVSSESLNLKESMDTEEVVLETTRTDVANKEDSLNRAIVDGQIGPVTTNSMPIIDETSLITSACGVSVPSAKQVESVVTESSEIVNDILGEAESKKNDLSYKQQIESSVSSPASLPGVQTTEDADAIKPNHSAEILSMAETLGESNVEPMEVDEATDSKSFTESKTEKDSENRLESDMAEPSSQGEMDCDKVRENLALPFAQDNAETSQEIPSQSYERSDVSEIGDSGDLPSQSLASKSENSREPSQSVSYERIEADEEAAVAEPPTQSFEHSKTNEASQSYEISPETSVNAPTQSFSEVKQNEGGEVMDEAMDDQSYPTQSYEIDKPDNLPENLEPDAEISQEGNIPSQSNDIGNDGIGTSSVSTNNSSLNEDETASSSYVPETPENQERDQDQESAISTSSYEIPPCEELNIASSSVIPDTSVRAEHTSIHDNGVPEIPTSSYNLNPDITSTHVDSVPTSSYEDQVIVEQNVSTSYEVPISMPGLDETSSRNFAAESTDRRNEPSSYYAHHQEVTASYYESVEQEAANSRIVEEDSQEEVTPSYYEANPQEASQSYFAPEEATPSYSTHNMSPNYYDPRPESEASQSYYSTGDLEKAERSSTRNIEASQSFYQEQPDELRLGQEGEATPTYSEGYSVDYALENSPMERHDLVESSVPATRPTER